MLSEDCLLKVSESIFLEVFIEVYALVACFITYQGVCRMIYMRDSYDITICITEQSHKICCET